MRGAAGVAPLRIVVLFVAALGNFRKGFGMVDTFFPIGQTDSGPASSLTFPDI